jgi:hypothetical protein
MSFWSNLDPTNPTSAFFHPVVAKKKDEYKPLTYLDPYGKSLASGAIAGGASVADAAKQAKDAIARRAPRDPNNPYDFTDQMLLQLRSQEVDRLGVGRTRVSTFGAPLAPTTATMKLYGGG